MSTAGMAWWEAGWWLAWLPVRLVGAVVVVVAVCVTDGRRAARNAWTGLWWQEADRG